MRRYRNDFLNRIITARYNLNTQVGLPVKTVLSFDWFKVTVITCTFGVN